jgi:hypothetical protein
MNVGLKLPPFAFHCIEGERHHIKEAQNLTFWAFFFIFTFVLHVRKRINAS